MYKSNREAGFSFVELFIVLVVVVAIALAGFFVIHKHADKTSSAKTASETSAQSKTAPKSDKEMLDYGAQTSTADTSSSNTLKLSSTMTATVESAIFTKHYNGKTYKNEVAVVKLNVKNNADEDDYYVLDLLAINPPPGNGNVVLRFEESVPADKDNAVYVNSRSSRSVVAIFNVNEANPPATGYAKAGQGYIQVNPNIDDNDVLTYDGQVPITFKAPL